MKFEIITLFPKMFDSPFAEGMMGRAIKNKLVELKTHDMRQWAWNSYGAVDDKPYGGDVGMLIRVDVIDRALKDIGAKKGTSSERIVLTSARGKKFDQAKAEEWSQLKRIILICGRYEGVDQRVADNLVDEEISIGNYVLSGGEIPAMVMIEATSRLRAGVLGKDKSSVVESFSLPQRLIEYPQYTRPQEYDGSKVPETLLSGDPKKIKEWQLEEGGRNNDESQENKN